ncbi:MAG: ferrochelatase [Pseudomonadales bacterium]|nr:ferrochelatase [Pseudomonadales bacterium]
MTKAVVLLNLGTPAEPTAKGLREFYKYFFSDPYVFDFNGVGRWLLRNLVILPFRAPRIAKDYAEIWMEQGSPLKVYADRMQQSVQESFDLQSEDVIVVNGMAYSEPYIWDVMQELERREVSDLLLLPMFPQYSTATTASVFNQVKIAAAKWQEQPNLIFLNDLFQEPAFIRAWSVVVSKHLQTEKFDHVIFSYHGVPEKTIKKADAAGVCEFGNCCKQINNRNRLCYRAQCVQTTESIVRALGWDEDSYSVAFQSRFGPLPWLQPYLDEHLKGLLDKDQKRVAVITPSFISDCLETLFEIGTEYRDEFMEAGGEAFELVPNLNDDQAWFNSVFEIARAHLPQVAPNPP